MLIKVIDPQVHTAIFSVIFIILLLISVRKNQGNFFSKDKTNQLKGFAILAIIFSHIGYSLSVDNRFLFPLSVLGGVGVNLFLFLSGFGLTISQLRSPLSVLSFYKKRLSKIFIPMWIVIFIFFLTDFFLLHRTYPLLEIIHNTLGFYPRADLFQNLDSPLWYFSIIFFYYLIFPLTFIKKVPSLSPILVLSISLLLLKLPLPVNPDLLKLYKLHFLAFPLGMIFGIIIPSLKFKLNNIIRWSILAFTILVLLYTSIHSGIGEDPKIEQIISIVTTLSLVVIFSLIRLNFKLLSIFGIYSYEIYLLHWPIISRYNLYLGLPPSLMVILNIVVFIYLAYILSKIINKITT